MISYTKGRQLSVRFIPKLKGNKISMCERLEKQAILVPWSSLKHSI